MMAVDLRFFEELLDNDNRKKVKKEIEKLVSSNFDLSGKIDVLTQERDELNSGFEDAKNQVADLAAINASLAERHAKDSAKINELLLRNSAIQSSLAGTKAALKKSEKENARLKNKVRIFQAMATTKGEPDLETED
jgi:chromosome segregation ATPase